MTKITQIKKDQDDLTVAHFDNGDTFQIQGGASTLISALVELHTVYDIEGNSASVIEMDPDIANALAATITAFPGVIVDYDYREDSFIAKLKNGDTGSYDMGFGESIFRAIAGLLRDQGFKSKLAENVLELVSADNLTVMRWVEDFQYGFQRISDDILASEMEAIYEPEKGAW